MIIYSLGHQFYLLIGGNAAHQSEHLPGQGHAHTVGMVTFPTRNSVPLLIKCSHQKALKLFIPLSSTQGNAYTERRVRSVREECLDNTLVVNENHLRNVLNEYTDYYNHSRPHQGISQHHPVPGSDKGNRSD